MEIRRIELARQSVPLIKPFKTALRTVHHAESIIVRVTLSDGRVGWGEAPPTLMITGESLASIEAAIATIFVPLLKGKHVLAYERLLQSVHRSIVGAGSAKAAIDMAIYDLISQISGLPLYKHLGGYRDRLETDYTVSVNSPQEMGEDAVRYVQAGYHVLKIKVGRDMIEQDVERIREIRERAGGAVKIRIDANQAWHPKDAIRTIRRMEDMGLNIELVEQPVNAQDIEGLKRVTDSVETLIMADESVFTPRQAFEVMKLRAADMINIKLMKSGGIYKAQVINQMAEEFGIECMVGSMIESRLAVTAAAHFAASKRNITRVDLDAPLMLIDDHVVGGVHYEGPVMILPEAAGLGILDVTLPFKEVFV